MYKRQTQGEAARELFDNARSLLDRITKERSLTARGVYGFWPAHSEIDDIVVYRPIVEGSVDRLEELVRFNMLRQQDLLGERPSWSLADLIAPSATGRCDYLGAFAVTAGIGADTLVKAYERDHDDYYAIMVKALADRLAEAFAEYLHARVPVSYTHLTLPTKA